MLNPPLSLLSQDLLDHIVDHAALPGWHEDLLSLSLVDRALTPRCQMHLFHELDLDDDWESKKKLKKQIVKTWKILNANTSLVKFIHVVSIKAMNPQIFSIGTFIRILDLLKESPTPPHTLRLLKRGDSMIHLEELVTGLARSSLSQTLATIELESWRDIPLSIFGACPNLTNITLIDLEFDGEPEVLPVDHRCPKNERLPKIERLSYQNSYQVVKQLINLAPSIMPIIDWSKLRILEASPHERAGMRCVQPILNVSSATLEELSLTLTNAFGPHELRQFSLKELVSLHVMANLRTFKVHVILSCRAREHAVLEDISLVLGTLPMANGIQKLVIRVSICGQQRKPFKGCLDENWESLCAQVVRIAAGKSLGFHLSIRVNDHQVVDNMPGEGVPYARIKDRVKDALADHSNIKFFPVNVLRTREEDK